MNRMTADWVVTLIAYRMSPSAVDTAELSDAAGKAGASEMTLWTTQRDKGVFGHLTFTDTGYESTCAAAEARPLELIGRGFEVSVFPDSIFCREEFGGAFRKPLHRWERVGG